jgi:hypothetical protein
MSPRERYVKLAATFAAIVIGTCSAAVAQPSSQASSAPAPTNLRRPK